MKPQKPVTPEIVATVALKRCACGAELRNNTYGERCEDCYVDGSTGRIFKRSDTPPPEKKKR